jgi:hypothetical protein
MMSMKWNEESDNGKIWEMIMKIENEVIMKYCNENEEIIIMSIIS